MAAVRYRVGTICVREEPSGGHTKQRTTLFSRPLPQVVFFIVLKILALLSAGLLYHLPRTLSTKIAAARKDFWLAGARPPVHLEVKIYFYIIIIIPLLLYHKQQAMSNKIFKKYFLFYTKIFWHKPKVCSNIII